MAPIEGYCHRPDVVTNFYEPSLAEIHHAHFGQLAEAAADTLLDELKARGCSSGRVTDLAPGSGILPARVLAHGFSATGVDVSPAMVALAQREAPGAHIVRGSLWDTRLEVSTAITAVGEAFCYQGAKVPRGEDLTPLFCRVAEALEPGGLFLFDVAGPGRAGPEGRYHSVRELGPVVLTVQVEEDRERQRLVRVIDSFVPEGELYRRDSERHVLTLFSPDEVVSALDTASLAWHRRPGYRDLPLGRGWDVYLAVRST